MNSHRQRAKRKTVTWQAASLALVAGAIGVAALPLGRLLGPGGHAGPKEDTGVAVAFKPHTLPGGEFMRTVESMKNLGGVVEVAVKPPEVPTEVEATNDTAPPPPPPPSTWAYTGYMKGPTIKKAVITIGPVEGGLQLMLSEGEAHEQTRLKEIHPDHILVDEAGKQQRIDLQTRSLAWDTSPPKRPAAARGPVGMPGMPGGAQGQPQAGFSTPNAAAMAEAQRRMKAAIAPTAPVAPQPDMAAMAKEMGGQYDQDKRDSLMKVMSEPGMSPEERGQLLREMGIPVDASPEERGEFLRNMGISEQSDPKLYEMLRDGGGSK